MTNYSRPTDIRQKGSNSLNMDSYTVTSASASFKRLHQTGQLNHAYLDRAFGKRDRIYHRIYNHFQGIVRHRDGQHFIISGSNKKSRRSDLFVVCMKSYLCYAGDPKYAKQAIRSNLITDDNRDQIDKILTINRVDKKLSHAGGISLLGDLLTVPLENGKGSKIVFLDFSKPASPAWLTPKIDRDLKAGCATSLKLENGRILCAVWTEDDGPHFDFYLSKSKDFSKGFKDDVMRVDYNEFERHKKFESPRFQNIQFIKQTNGKVFIIGTDNKGKGGGKENRMYLLEIIIDDALRKILPKNETPKIKIVDFRVLSKYNLYYNLNAAAGLYVDDQKKLALYAGRVFRSGRKPYRNEFRFAEFYEKLPVKSKLCKDIRDSVIELYTEIDFTGRCLIIHVQREGVLPDYSKIKGDGGHFNDCIKSIRYLLPKGRKYIFYENDNYNSGKSDKNELTLIGSGYLENISDLSDKAVPGRKFKRSFSKKISSSMLAP